MKKRMVAAALVFSAAFVFPVFAGEWEREEAGNISWKYREGDGSYVSNAWRELDGKWYYFDHEGKMVTGICRIDGKEQNFREDGSWIDVSSGTSSSATVVAGTRSVQSSPGAGKWEQDERGWYYQNSDGSFAKSAWRQIRGKWYHFNEEGYMETGLITVDGTFYFLEEDGAMISNESRTVNGVTYSFDGSGAGNMEWRYKQPLAIPAESEKSDFHKSVDAMADSILAGITDSGMSQRQKAVAIYHWVKGNMRYSGFSPVGDWVGGAYDGIRKHHGDCYTYYALSAELLNRAGMQTIEVIRSSDNNHYWNLVNVDGSWYHFDPCPRRTGGDFCLLTDAQIAPSRAHVFDHSLYPPTP